MRSGQDLQQVRRHLIGTYAFGIPGEEALDCLARHAPIVEMGAGLGYWARCLRERGVDVVAYDAMSDQWQAWFRPTVLERTAGGLVARSDPLRFEPVLWTEVLEGGPERLAAHAERTLLLCWPDLWSGFDEESLRAYEGERVVCVGELGERGTGSDGFRRLLGRAWRPIDDAPVPRWPGCDDHLVVYARSASRGTSRTTSRASLSSRRPLKLGARSSPPFVHSENSNSATSLGSM